MGRDDLRATVATLQKALDLAHQRIRQAERAGAEMNQRYAEALARADQSEIRLHDQDAEARRRG